MKKLILSLLIVLISSTTNAITDAQFDTRLLKRINEYRLTRLLKPLAYSVKADSAASFHSRYLAKAGVFTHAQTEDVEDFTEIVTLEDRLTKYGVIRPNFYGECIHVYAYDGDVVLDSLVESVFQGWKNSPLHNAIMLNETSTKAAISFSKGTHLSWYYKENNVMKKKTITGLNCFFFVLNVFNSFN